MCVIDSLCAGGAQRQIVNLACGLKNNGHDVEMLIYHPRIDFFRSEVDSAGIIIHDVIKGNGFSWKVVLKLLLLIKSNRFCTIISFLDAPNIYCELAKAIIASNITLIVSERSSRISNPSRFYRLIHHFADKVIVNSYNHADWLMSFPFLRKKVNVIYNGYFINKQLQVSNINEEGNFHFLVVGRIDKGKNGIKLIEALIELHDKFAVFPKVSWIGRQPRDMISLNARQKMEDLLSKNLSVKSNWEWVGECSDVHERLCSCDALIHISLYEGLPNVVCEAFIAGKPVIASNVCDHPLLVEDGKRGFLCDPLSPESISNSIMDFINLTPTQRKKLGENARHYAEQNLTVDRMLSVFERLFLHSTLIN